MRRRTLSTLEPIAEASDPAEISEFAVISNRLVGNPRKSVASNTIAEVHLTEDIPVEEWLSNARRELELLREENKGLKRSFNIQVASAKQALKSETCARSALHLCLSLTNQPVILIDRNGFIQLWNEACERLTGIPGKKVAGHDFSEILFTELSQKVCQLLTKWIESDFGTKSIPHEHLVGPILLCNGHSISSLTVFPICRIPNVLEAIILLVENEPV